LAADAIDSGRAMERLEHLVALTQQLATEAVSVKVPQA
jgi:hypothetical protein